MTPVEQLTANLARLHKEHVARVRSIDRTEKLMKWLIFAVALWAITGCAGFQNIVANWPTCSDPCLDRCGR